MNGPSTNLSWKELACKDGSPYPEQWRTSRAIALSSVFELIRSECGHKPITILSAYRSESWNKKIGGARFSQHKEGRALDLRPPKGMSVDKFHWLIKDLARITSIRGIGKYKTFVHVDIRPSDRLVVWSGSGVKDSGTKDSQS